MDTTSTFGAILTTLQSGLPVLLLQFLITLFLLGVGIAAYFAISPFDERRLIREGNVAAGIVMAGALIALAIPLAATLANSTLALDILLWGIVALVLQLLTLGLATMLVRGLRNMIETGNIAAALTLASVQVSVALLNAGAMSG
jgi:putative membrane protein